MEVKSLLLILVSTFLLTSCKKESQQKYLNAEFVAASITKDGSLKVFSEGGKVLSDVNVIQNFTKDEMIFSKYDQTSANGERIKFISADSLYFTDAKGTPNARFSYQIQGTQILIQETHTEMMGQLDPFAQQLYTAIVKYQPITSESYSVPGIGGSYTYRKVTTTAVGYLTPKELKLYRFAFKYRIVSDNLAFRTYTGLPMNKFNEDFLKSLTAQHTLAIQAYTLNFKRGN